MIFAFQAYAWLDESPFELHPQMECLKLTKRLVQKWGGGKHWKREWSAPGKHKIFLYSSPTKTIGEWVRLELKNTSLNAYKLSAGVTLKISRLSNCIPKVQIYNHPRVLKQTGFHDRDLEELLQEKVKGIIYVWDGSHPRSLEGLEDTKKLAKRFGLSLTLLQDGEISPEKEKKIKTIYGSTELNQLKPFSLELKMRGLGLHYPHLFFFKNKRIMEQGLLGPKNYDQILEFIQSVYNKN